MGQLIKEDIARVRTFQWTFRLIGDICILNDGGEFQNLSKEIYYKELVRKCEHSGSQSTFLDINIIIGKGKISTKFYDERDDFSLMFACKNFIASFYLFFWSCDVWAPLHCKIIFFCYKLLWKE